MLYTRIAWNRDINTFNWFKKALAIGNPDAKYYIAMLFYSGKIQDDDKSIAFKWMHDAANDGNYVAEYAVGAMYDKGDGVEKDLEKAVKWYQKAAGHDNVNAMYSLAMMYRDGDFFQKSYLLSYIWLSRALRIAADDSNPDIVVLWNNDLVEIRQHLNQEELDLAKKELH